MSSKSQELPVTDVSIVLQWLVDLDDFASRDMIHEGTGLPANRVRTALANLAKHFAVDCVIVNQNELWFYATPDTDNRKRLGKASPVGSHRREKGRASAKREVIDGIPKSYVRGHE